MAENFPKTTEAFIEQYSFIDKKEVYTNGAELIAVFRVKQMLEHYFAKDTNVLTNADRIRAMSDEELADFWNKHYDDFCVNKPECGNCINEDREIPAEWCQACALAWLHQPAEEVPNA